MTAYLWVILVLLGSSAAGQCLWIVTDRFPPRTRGVTLADMLVNLGLVAWATYLLIHGVA